MGDAGTDGERMTTAGGHLGDNVETVYWKLPGTDEGDLSKGS